MLHLQQKKLCLLAHWSARGLSALPSHSMLDRPMATVLKVLVKSTHSKLHERGAQGHTFGQHSHIRAIFGPLHKEWQQCDVVASSA